MLQRKLLLELSQCFFANWLVGIVFNMSYPSLALSLIFIAWNYWGKNQASKIKNRYLIYTFIPLLIFAFGFIKYDSIKNDNPSSCYQITLK